MFEKREFAIKNPKGGILDIDLFIHKKKPSPNIIIFCHGFKGFKDWGCFELMAAEFVKAGFSFLKFNFSLNGVKIKANQPESKFEFNDLEAFGNNTYSQEAVDIQSIIKWVEEYPDFNFLNINLLGHSRGGAISLIEGINNPSIKKVCSWSAPNDLAWSWKNESAIEEWKKKGIIYTENKRTNQKMPLKYSLYQDYLDNKNHFNIRNLIENTPKPVMIIHGSEDDVVPVSCAIDVKRWNSIVQLEIIPAGSHTFGAKHPWESESLPMDLGFAIQHSIRFFSQV